MKSEIIKEICTCADCGMHFSHLLPYISQKGITKDHIDEFKNTLKWAIEEAKRTKQAVLINGYCGNFDLLVTECRIHIILITRSFELPELD